MQVMLRWLCDWYITNRLITVVPSQTRFLFQLVHGKSLHCHCRSDIQCRIDFQMCIIWNNGIWLVEREPACSRGPAACARAFEIFRIACLASCFAFLCITSHDDESGWQISTSQLTVDVLMITFFICQSITDLFIHMRYL